MHLVCTLLKNPSCIGFAVLAGGLRPWSQKGPDHGVGVPKDSFEAIFVPREVS